MRRLVVYALVGATGTAVQYAVLIACVHMRLLQPPAASFIGAALGAIVNYVLNHRFTFTSTRGHAGAASRFFVVATCAAVINWVAMLVLVGQFGVQYLLAQCFTTASVMLLTYAANASWSFRAAPESA